jgi:hypothetical protein
MSRIFSVFSKAITKKCLGDKCVSASATATAQNADLNAANKEAINLSSSISINRCDVLLPYNEINFNSALPTYTTESTSAPVYYQFVKIAASESNVLVIYNTLNDGIPLTSSILYSTDDGENFNNSITITSYNWFNVISISGQYAYAIDILGNLYSSTNSGASFSVNTTYQAIFNSTFSPSIACYDASYVAVTSSSVSPATSYIYYSTNCGESFTIFTFGTSEFTGISMSSQGIVACNNGNEIVFSTSLDSPLFTSNTSIPNNADEFTSGISYDNLGNILTWQISGSDVTNVYGASNYSSSTDLSANTPASADGWVGQVNNGNFVICNNASNNSPSFYYTNNITTEWTSTSYTDASNNPIIPYIVAIGNNNTYIVPTTDEYSATLPTLYYVPNNTNTSWTLSTINF